MSFLNRLIAPTAALLLAAPLATAAQAAGPQDYRGGAFDVARVATFTPRINNRIDRQRMRIRRGVRRGDLTRNEARRVRENLQDIRFVRRKARRDGLVSLGERRRLMRLLDRNSRVIRRLSNNGRVRF